MQTKSKQWAKGVITKVPLDLSTHDIKMETEAIWVHRITKRTNDGFIPTSAVIIDASSSTSGDGDTVKDNDELLPVQVTLVMLVLARALRQVTHNHC